MHLLQSSVASRASQSKKVLVLNLPRNQGGSREFENREIRNIAAALKENHALPTYDEVKQCMEKILAPVCYPLWCAFTGFESSRC